MANRSGWERAGHGVARRPPGLVEPVVASDGDEGEDGAGAVELGHRSSAWERMLERLAGEDDVGGLEDGVESLHASIAERVRVRAGGLGAVAGRRSSLRSARRRRR
jgi:hypothetical protein